jgi:hypothetical protein
MIDKEFELEIENTVIYDGSAKSVDQIMTLAGKTQGILNCYEDTKSLLFNEQFYPVGTVFKKVEDGIEIVVF